MTQTDIDEETKFSIERHSAFGHLLEHVIESLETAYAHVVPSPFDFEELMHSVSDILSEAANTLERHVWVVILVVFCPEHAPRYTCRIHCWANPEGDHGFKVI